MLTPNQILTLLSDIESDRIERTVSTTNTDKFGQAICAFAHYYEGNGPVQFYQYDDRIEIMNPGGLYGKATPENFPFVNDYRNGVVAEGMKVLGFVNRYSRGVQAVQSELKANGNGEADFRLHLSTAFLVVERISTEKPRKEGEKPRKEGEKPRKEAEKPRKEGEISRKEAEKPRKELKKTLDSVLEVMRNNPRITYKQLQDILGIKESAVFSRIRKLKELGLLRREGGRSSGYWIVIE